jgi:hypothetical protein
MVESADFKFLDNDTFDALTSGQDAAPFDDFLAQTYLSTRNAMNSARELLTHHIPPPVYPALIPVTLSLLVAPPKAPQVKKEAVSPTTSSYTPDITMPKPDILHTDKIKPKPVPVVKSVFLQPNVKKEPLKAPHIKATQTHTKAVLIAPKEDAKNSQKPSSQDPKFKKISAELQEKQLKERQAKLSDLFNDKGTVS